VGTFTKIGLVIYRHHKGSNLISKSREMYSAKRGGTEEERMKQKGRLRCATLVGALFISTLLLGVEASAADQNPCSEDIATFCKDVGSGRAAIMECLERHESRLSDACKDYEAKMEKPRMEAREVVWQQMRVRQACREDVAKFCNDVTSESGGIGMCLKEHTSALSMPCKEAMEAARGGEEERKAK
jgi:hypothetical protein